MPKAEFDRYSTTYDDALGRSLTATGEDRDFYANGRIDWTAECVLRLGLQVGRILDYGCGDGRNVKLLAERFKAEKVLGVDVSSGLIELARESYQTPSTSFSMVDEWKPDGTMDLAFVNGVFHHIQPLERLECLTAIRGALKPGGLFAFWENNPWNPGTRYVMSQCEFDENAITISPHGARRVLAQAGFLILRLDSLFYFPRQLRILRPAELWLRRIPLGGQYQVLCQTQ